jgi:hypothetical protein
LDFRFTEFTEVRHTLAKPSNSKDTTFGDVPYLTILVRCLPRAGRGPEPRPAEKVGT